MAWQSMGGSESLLSGLMLSGREVHVVVNNSCHSSIGHVKNIYAWTLLTYEQLWAQWALHKSPTNCDNTRGLSLSQCRSTAHLPILFHVYWKKAITKTLYYKMQTNMFSWRTTRTKLSNMKNAFCPWFATFSIVLQHLIFVYHWWELLVILSSVRFYNFSFI